MRPNHSTKTERGFSLVEVMVATAILVVVLVGILMLYDRANRVFKTGNEAAEMQQNLRIAYERMVGDVRMAGFDYKRGGPLLAGQNAAPWGSSRPYSSGTIVTPTAPNGHTYRAMNAGTSGPTQPAWPTGTGAFIVENGATPPITWQENGGAVYEQPDEQIEYAGATAVTLRANFDYSVNPTADDHGTEPGIVGVQANLESTQFPIVTTGNDEIVTYALVSNRAPRGTAPNNQSITLYADVSVPRNAYPGGAAESLVTISGVDLTNANPPYTLYRFTFARDVGNPNAANFLVATPLADNIRSLNLFYFEDSAGQRPLTNAAGAFVPNLGGQGQYDPAVAGSVNAPDRLVRRKIRSVRVRLVGMNGQPDINFSDTSTANGLLSTMDTAGYPTFASDTVAPTYRRIAVDTLIQPRNLGLTGLPQNFLNPPPRPTLTNVCIGYCGIAVVSWDPNTNNPNASYVVAWDTDPAGSFTHALDAGTSNTYAVDLTQQDLSQTFYFQVRALNAGGGATSTNTLSASAANATDPNPPNTIVASGGGSVPAISGRVHLTWVAPVTVASGAPSCTPAGTPSLQSYLSEIKGFRIFRGAAANFVPSGTTAGVGNCVIDENSSGANAPTDDGYGDYAWDDTNVSCGQTYYYKLQTVEWCSAAANYNTSGNINDSISNSSTPGIPGVSGSTGTPRVPLGLEVAPLAPTPPQTGMTNSACNAGVNACDPINLRWVKVTQDTAGSNLSIDSYDIERTQYNILGIPTGPATVINITGALLMPGSYVTYTDTALMHDPITFANFTYKYRVRAVQPNPCPTGGYTLPITFPPPCTFSGSVIVETGATLGDGLTPASAWIMNAGDTIQVQPPIGTTLATTDMTIVDPSGATVATYNSTTSPALFTWLDLVPGTPYTVTFTITNNAFPPCTEQLVRYITQQPTPACSLTTFATQASILSNTATTYQLKLDLRNAGSEPLTLRAIDFNWTPPSRITWNSVQFPSGATVVGPGTTGGAYTATLFPLPGLLTTGDITVPANGTESILINMARTNGNPANITPSVINTICVTYQTPTQGLLVGDFHFHCQIKPTASVNNPNACQ